jgi:hypothetical protein
MSAKYAVLGLVIERPGYGYQLAQRLEERFGSSEFAPSGVYSALDQLSRDSLIRSAGEMGGGSSRRAAPRTIEIVCGQELACMGRLSDLKQRADEDPPDPHEWSSLMRTLSRDAEVAVWNARIEWLQSARELLEQLGEEPDHTRARQRAAAGRGSRLGHLQVL